MKETGLTGKRRSTTIAATPDDGNSQRKRRRSLKRAYRKYELIVKPNSSAKMHLLVKTNLSDQGVWLIPQGEGPEERRETDKNVIN